MRNSLIKSTAVSLILTLFMTTACTNLNQGGGTQNAQNLSQQNPNGVTSQSIGMQQLSTPGNVGDGNARIPTVTLNGKTYVPIKELVDTLEFQSEWDEGSGTFKIGDNDVAFEIKPNSQDAVREEESIKLSDAPITSDGKTYLPVSAIADLFAEDMMDYRVEQDNLVITASTIGLSRDNMDAEDANINPTDVEGANGELDFADDPEDPFKDDDEQAEQASSMFSEWNVDSLAQQEAVPVLKNINISSMIRTARRYLGVKYRFGAGSYSKTGRFDCSTYTRYVFGKYNINLPRTARAQARLGTSVSRKKLRKGDLLYFYVPGRFKSNRKVGHVGIYIGGLRMIHASPEPKNGVQITNINKAYWKKTYLFTKRIAT